MLSILYVFKMSNLFSYTSIHRKLFYSGETNLCVSKFVLVSHSPITFRTEPTVSFNSYFQRAFGFDLEKRIQFRKTYEICIWVFRTIYIIKLLKMISWFVWKLGLSLAYSLQHIFNRRLSVASLLKQLQMNAFIDSVFLHCHQQMAILAFRCCCLNTFCNAAFNIPTGKDTCLEYVIW